MEKILNILEGKKTSLINNIPEELTSDDIFYFNYAPIWLLKGVFSCIKIFRTIEDC